MKDLYLCGAGNPEGVRLALAIQAARQCWSNIVLLDDDPAKHGRVILGVAVAGPFERLASAGRDAEAASLVARTTVGRAATRERIRAYGVPLVALVHPQVDVLGVELEGDVTVYRNAVLSAESRVGEGSVVFTGAVVGHGSSIGRNCVLAPGAVTSARVVVEDGAYLGTNSSVLPELVIGAGAVIGAGSAVLSDVPRGVTVMGVPAAPFGVASRHEGVRDTTTEPSAEPDADLVEAIRGTWCDLLQLDVVGLDVNFFDVGGTSLAALELTRRIRSAFDIEVAITDVFRFGSVRTLARFADAMRNGSTAASPARGRAAARRARRTA